MLTREQIRRSPKRRVSAPIPVPALAPPGTDADDAVVCVCSMSVRERREFFAKGGRYRDDEGKSRDNSVELIVADFACDADGNRIFEPEDVEELTERDAETVSGLALAVLEFSSLTKEAVKQAEKNSEATPSDSSSSD